MSTCPSSQMMLKETYSSASKKDGLLLGVDTWNLNAKDL